MDPLEHPAEAGSKQASGGEGPQRILVADDDPTILRLLTAILADRGHEVRATSEGEEVERMLKGDRCTLAILGVETAGGTGLRRVRRARERGCRVPVVVMSGSFPPEMAGGAGGIARLALLEMPFTCMELESAIHRALADGSAV